MVIEHRLLKKCYPFQRKLLPQRTSRHLGCLPMVQADGRVVYASLSYLLPLQIAEGAALGLAVPCTVTAGVGLTATPSVGGAVVWTTTPGPLAGKVSQVPRGETEDFSAPGQESTPCPNTTTKRWYQASQ